MLAISIAAFLCTWVVLCSCGAVGGYVKYNTGSGIVEGKLNVHLVPHSHDDVGWLKTVDQYYVGSNNSIQGACVENVLDSVVVSLLRDPNRKFVFAEMAFFQRWWEEQNVEIQEEVRKLVDAGQLEFVNGGWCMHDEAATHYIDMIDQTTLGHRLIKDQFNITPRAGWQIDPFGHSGVQAYLLGSECILRGLIIRTEQSAGKTSLWKLYGADPELLVPPLRYLLMHSLYITVLQRDLVLKWMMIPFVSRIILFYVTTMLNSELMILSMLQSVKDVTRTNHIMWTMGDDFQYQYAESWFRQMDKLIHYVNKDGRINALYSTPSTYTDAKNVANESWPLKIDDYFPYADDTNRYFTGYYTSRPGLKQYVRMLSGYYLAARQLEFLAGRKSAGPNTYSLGDALGIVQHHDAVSGTARQHTTDDYAKRLAIGAFEAEAVVSSALSCLTNSGSKDQCATPSLTATYETSTPRPIWEFHQNKFPSTGFCFQYPYLLWVGTRILFPKLLKSKSTSTYTSMVELPLNETLEIGPGNLKIFLSSASGRLERMFNSKTGVNMLVQQSYLWYASSSGDSDPQCSGAYIFRPNGSTPFEASRSVPLKIVRGPLVDEVHQQFNSWIYQVIRLYKDKEHAEVEFTIGPIPTDDGTGKEVITRMTANMATDKVFYTDANGRDFLKRVRDYREDWSLTVHQPVAGNYYPVNLGIFIADKKSEFSVLVDHATGGASIEDGEVELMLHRRMVYDDSGGLVGPLNETVCAEDSCEALTVRGKYYISINQLGAGSRWRRTTGQEVYSPVVLAFTHEKLEDWTVSHLAKATTMDPNYSLPMNVALITLQELDDGRVLLRLAHLYEAEEDAEYSTLAKVELKKMFLGKMIKEMKEMSLSANQEKSQMKGMIWKVEDDNGGEPTAIKGGPVNTSTLVVELGPMEIRTFVLKF
ncbi:Alpha-mannosidase, light subunit like [Actinidia chinensis var. chinensis]|uniref:alpha-mannosidase n=1 Tax=Actinidia chinensis var. chinensis TaxID=1590841 RepID=A0A2R6R5Y4_ACTCC|nr:Alpha-mannosidase, light subunit like [Actinidia chinensis var. chinensis]